MALKRLPISTEALELFGLIRDSDSVYLYSDSIALENTLPLTAEDVALHRHISVAGCYEVSRDPLRDHAILDPAGDEEFATEMKYGTAVPMKVCVSRRHKGRTLIPAVEFEEGATKCRRCQRFDEFLNRGKSTPEQSPKREKWFRQMHEDGRRHGKKHKAATA